MSRASQAIAAVKLNLDDEDRRDRPKSAPLARTTATLTQVLSKSALINWQGVMVSMHVVSGRNDLPPLAHMQPTVRCLGQGEGVGTD